MKRDVIWRITFKFSQWGGAGHTFQVTALKADFALEKARK